jgi:hypothetical protein
MSDLIKTTFVLTGALEGKTITLGSQEFQFVNGKMETVLSPKDTGRIALFLNRNWQALPEIEVKSTVAKAVKTAKKTG